MIPQIEPEFGEREAEALGCYILSGGWGTEHGKTLKFEAMVGDYVGSRHVSAVNNGTMGLILSLLALGIKPGDYVIVPALTMIATANAVRFIGAIPKFIDIEWETGCLDINRTLQVLDSSIKAVVYVSLNGRCGEIEKLIGKVPVIEDACQSFGSRRNGKYLGTIGDIGVYSLSPHKIISTGQGGLVVTNNKELHENIERLKDFGRLSGGSENYPFFGINSKFTDFQAVIGIEQLKDIDRRIARKREIFDMYHQLIKTGFMLGHPDVPWMVDVYDTKRNFDDFQTRPMYPVIPHEPCYSESGHYPISEELSRLGTWLPSSILLKNEEIEEICRQVNA